MKPCLICCTTYNKVECHQACIDSLFKTADPALYSLLIIDNASTDGTVDWLKTLDHPCIEDILYLEENVGTARGLNRGWKLAFQRGQHPGKLDGDNIFYDTGWLHKMLSVLEITEDVGLVGLKRRDLEEKPNHNSLQFRTQLVYLPNNQIIEIAEHVIGTCWLVSHNLINEIGGLAQPGLYGLDDALFCLRAKLAGWVVCFVPDVAIEHVDPGHPKYPEYTQWKIDQATDDLRSGRYDAWCNGYREGTRPLYEDFPI